MAKKVKFTLTFKRGPQVVATVVGLERDADITALADILEVERITEAVTGLRCHVDMVESK